MLLCLLLFAYVIVDCVLLLFVCVGVRALSVVMCFAVFWCCLCLLVVFVFAGGVFVVRGCVLHVIVYAVGLLLCVFVVVVCACCCCL